MTVENDLIIGAGAYSELCALGDEAQHGARHPKQAHHEGQDDHADIH